MNLLPTTRNGKIDIDSIRVNCAALKLQYNGCLIVSSADFVNAVNSYVLKYD